MIWYSLFTLSCAALGLIYLNRGRGSSRIYASIGAVGTFLVFMAVIGYNEGAGMETVLSAGAASVICGAAAYWLVLLEQWLWRGGAVKKTAALLGCLAFCFLAVPVWLIGTAVLRLFRRQLSEADDALAQQTRAVQQAKEKQEQRKREIEAEICRASESDDALCIFFASLYERRGYRPVLERAGEDGPLRMLLDKGGETIAFVAISRREVLGPEAVEWAAQFRGSAAHAGLVTAGTFTRRAARRAEQLQVLLVDRPNLPRFIRAARQAEKKRAFGTGGTA